MTEPTKKLIEAMTHGWPENMDGGPEVTAWNYRIVESEERGEPIFSLHEVYYTVGGKVDGWTGPILDGFESVDALLRELVLMGRAGGWPVIPLDAMKGSK